MIESMKIYKIIILLGFLSIVLGACVQDTVSPEDEELTKLNAYIKIHYPDAEPTKSGLYFIPQKTGYGNKPLTNDSLTIHYIGKLIDGTEFDNTYTDEEAFTYVVGGSIEVISGFREGILLMREGQTAVFIMPSTLAYGARQNGLIPPYSSLIFEVELRKIY
jgi:FKBP-type peptidyl-prolyl cis-trans isomerase